MNADLSIITHQVYTWINESNTDFNLHFGEKNLYLVVEWIDGDSLFIEDYFNFMNELIMAYCDLDEDTDEEKVYWFNKLFGIGSEYHGIANGRWADDEKDSFITSNSVIFVDFALESQTADLNKMEKERDI